MTCSAWKLSGVETVENVVEILALKHRAIVRVGRDIVNRVQLVELLEAGRVDVGCCDDGHAGDAQEQLRMSSFQGLPGPMIPRRTGVGASATVAVVKYVNTASAMEFIDFAASAAADSP